MVVIYTLLSVTFVSLLSLLGASFLFLKRRVFEEIIFVFIALSSGALLATAFFDLLPEALATVPNQTPALIIFGIVFFFLIEKIINWHHCTNENECRGELPVGWLSLVGDGIHNFVDGAAIAAAFTTDTRLGIVTTVAVAAHEIPSELSDFAVLIYAGFSNSRAIFFNLISALTAVLGALSVLRLSSKYLYLTDFLLPVAAGNFIYIAGTSLFPELHKRRNPTTTILETSLIVLGVVLIVLVKNSFE